MTFDLWFILTAAVRLRLESHEIRAIADAATTYRLDFDDACQYAAAEKYGLELVSFDGDFDYTLLGRKTPGGVVSL